MTIVEKIQWSKSAGPGVFNLVDLAQKAGHGITPSRAISCLTAKILAILMRKKIDFAQNYPVPRQTL